MPPLASRQTRWTLLALPLVLFCVAWAETPSVALIGGSVFDGESFEQRDLYIVDGRFTDEKPSAIDTTLEVTGRFLVPPYGDAHTHNLDRRWQIPALSDQYLGEGTFYVQNLTSKTKDLEFFRDYFASPETPDVTYSHQGLTSTLGHPFLAYEPFTMGLGNAATWPGRMEEIKRSRLDENNSYLFLDSLEDADKKLPAYFAGKPDVVKIFLVDVGNYAENSANEKAGDSGLSPELAIHITREAHARGLRVFAHIDTARDFEVGVEAGVDGFAHMPTWNGDPATWERFKVPEEVLESAIDQGIGITPTLTITSHPNPESPEAANQREFMARFLDEYVTLGGIVLAGSDLFNRTLRAEIQTWIDDEVFDPVTLLQILSEITPQAIFPERKIGRIADGFEGSVLVLGGDPLDDPNLLFDVEIAVKQGRVLDLE